MGGRFSQVKKRDGTVLGDVGNLALEEWDPAYSGSYSLVWELHVEGLRLHTGGEFEKVSGVVQNSYARLSPASP